MTMKDELGHTVSGADATSLASYEKAIGELRCFIGDPVASVDEALSASPDFTMAHVLKAYLHLLGTEPEALSVAREALRSADRLPADARERGHVEAVRCLAEGRWHDAGQVLEDVSIAYPVDALALQAGHQIDFFTGSSRMLRDRIARALPAWSEGMPGYHAVLGMHAFGLEETGDYARAEAQGRKGVELEPRDGWAQHAVAHVMEMQGRQRDGIAWMRADPAAWSRESFFCVHNWWHLALYHLDLGEVNEVLALFDGPIYGSCSKVALDMVDASALLWRLHLRGIDVGDRWQVLADNWAPVAVASNYTFNDVHAVMAFVGAGRTKAADAVLEAQTAAMERPGDNAAFTREVGHPVAQAIRAFGEGDYAQTVRLLRPVRSIAHRFGGSHAQRDVLDLTLIEAAFRSGQTALARALAAERIAAKPTSPLAKLFVERARSAEAA
ncbi:MAG TPA: tetratricopeptide repeat protein [Alphaproteobacteria bacterium]|nr:tetratricopeptide repeat protein [Alphaproteobacteria bacterium]